MKSTWFLVLLSFICLEGLGRKFLPAVPGFVFYFAKDAILLYGVFRFRPSERLVRISKGLYGSFRLAWVGAFGWTVLELINPDHGSFALGLIGLRAYWLWWIAPIIVADVLEEAKERRRAIYVLAILSIAISLFAMLQFASPATASINNYAYVDGEAVTGENTVVASTGRARVASTFSFITGFTDFTTLAPALLLSLGLGTSDPPLRRIALAAALALACTIPMSGSRSAIVLGIAVLAVIAWSAGLFFTPLGRRVLIGAVFGAIVATSVFPDAMQGVQDRFTSSEEETNRRFSDNLQILPPVAMATFDYPMIGLGTGMQQNARFALHVPDVPYDAENENERYLVELGPVGLSLVWLAKLGLCVGLLRAWRVLKNADRRAASGTALAYSFLTFFGNLTFDHVWQSLYFVGVGFVLAEVAAVVKDPSELAVKLKPVRATARASLAAR